MVNIRKFTGVTFTHLDQLVERDMVSTTVARFLSACVRSGLSIDLQRCSRLGQDHDALVLRGRDRSRPSGS